MTLLLFVHKPDTIITIISPVIHSGSDILSRQSEYPLWNGLLKRKVVHFEKEIERLNQLLARNLRLCAFTWKPFLLCSKE